MEHTKLVIPNEMEIFAGRRDSEGVIPELVALLVNLSVPDLTVCRIPYGDSICLPGFDGLVQTESGFRQYVPSGISYWEIGRNEDAQDKATEEYRKRTDATSIADRGNASFVFVTPRSRDWDQPSQSKWIQRRQGDGWKDVKVLDGVQLCDWLREFPVVGKWLLQRIGLVKGTTGFQTPAEHWKNLSELSDPPLPTKIFLAGREVACQQLERVFRGEVQQLILSIESEHDAEDFVAAYLHSLDDEARRAFASRCLFISEADAWQTFGNLRARHVLVASPRLDLADAHEQLHMAAKGGGHGIVLSVSGAWSHGAEKLVPILSPSRSSLENTLADCGFQRDRASELASAGAQSLSGLKRHLRGLGELPPYATWDNARLLAQASLAGRWKGTSKADREAMEILLGKSYGEWIDAARAETLRPDTPLIQRNEAWKIISRGEAWSALGPRINDDDLDRFKEMAIRVLGEKDPQFELPKDERHLASIHDKALTCSRSLREGMAESLALLGARGNALSSASIGKAEGTARIVVHKLLHEADWVTWASLNNEIPLLAEAAPDTFLDAVESALVDPAASPFVDVFKQEGAGALGGWNYITGLLWGLETLAWHPDYLGRVTILLGDLAAIDPGGNWANRPRNSLSDIYLPWHAQTLAQLPQRIAAIEALLRERPDVAWGLLLSLLPNAHGATSGNRKPVWRPYIPRTWTQTITRGQYWDQVRAYAEICTRVAATDLPKLEQLVDRLADLPEPAHVQVLAHLGSAAVTSLPEDSRLPLWEALKDVASKHRKFANAQWAMPADRVAKIEEVAERLSPKSSDLINRRLFTERDFDLYEKADKFEVQRQRLDERRQNAVKQVLEAEGPEGVVRFARKVESPRKVGDALGAIESQAVDEYLLPQFLQGTDKDVEQFVGSFVWRRFWTQKIAWVDNQLGRGWTKDKVLAMVLLLPSEPEIWQRVQDALGTEIATYWERVRLNPWGLEKEALMLAAERLVAHEQPATALDCLYLLSQKKVRIPMALATAVMEGLLKTEDRQKGVEQHHVVEVIKWLQENESTESEELFRIEWQFLPLLNRLYGGEPKVLEHRLASSPAFFREVIAAVFRSDKETSGDKPEVTEEQKRIAHNAYSLLHGWKILPGTLSDGAFDGQRFAVWLDEAKKLTKESGHFKIAMDQLGQALANAPQDPNGLWIHESIAAALDSRDVPEMRRAFAVGLFNKRGVHGFSHGEEEKVIAAGYREKAKALSDKGFHRVADAVRGLADDYERDAQRESRRDIFDER